MDTTRLGRIRQAAHAVLTRAWAGLRAACTTTIGQVSWQAPGWMHWIATQAIEGRRYAKTHPRLTLALLATVLAFGMATHQGLKWWKARPKPVEVAFKVVAPSRTPVENEDENDRGPRPLYIRFAHSVAPLSMSGKDVPDGIVIRPALEGKWKWSTDKELEFSPKEDWPVGTTHTVSFDKQIFAPQIRLDRYSTEFNTPAFVVQITRSQFYQDPTNPSQKKAVFEIGFSHPVNTTELEKRIALQLAGQAEGIWGIGRETTKFTVSYDKLKLAAYVHSEQLATPQEDSRITLNIAKGVPAARGGTPYEQELSPSVAVPGQASLSVSALTAEVAQNRKSEPEQILTAALSASTLERDVSASTTAWLLPVHHPNTPKNKRTTPHRWENAQEVSEDVLKAATRLELELVSGEREHNETHAFRYRAPVGRYLYVQIERGMKSFGGYVLARRFQNVLRVPPFPPQLNIMGQGSLLTLAGDQRVGVMVRDVPGVHLEIGRILPSQLQHLVSQSEGRFDKPNFFGTFGIDNLAERFEKKIPLPRLKQGKAHYESLNLGDYLKKDGAERRGIFYLRVRGYDPKTRVPVTAPDTGEPDPDGEAEDRREADDESGDPSEREDTRLLLVTDLGILVKRALDGSQDVFVQSLSTGLPVAGAEVEVIGKNGIALFSQPTDTTGRAQFAKLSNLSRERTPLLYVVRKAGDMSFLPLNRADRGLDFSRFDVGGIRNTVQPGTLSAYLFSNRGIYRPGDMIHIGVIVKSANWTAIAGLPLEVDVTDPRGLSVKRERIKLGSGGFNEISHATQESSPTGNYTFSLYTVKDGQSHAFLGSATVRVQEFLPDRMKVTAKLSAETADGWVSPADLTLKVNAQNLFGTPAADRRVEASITLQPSFPSFRNFPEYRFYDPNRAKEGYNSPLDEGKTDEAGNADFALDLERYAKATYRLHVLAKVFEAEGGRYVAAETASLVSELPYLVGYKPDGDLGYVSVGSKRTVHVVAVNPKARPHSVSDMKLELIERRFVSVLVKQPNGTYKYESKAKEVTVKESAFSIVERGTIVALDTSSPGTFFYRLRNAEGIEQNRIEFTVAGNANVARTLDRNAELQLTLKSKEVVPGQDIEVNIRAPYVGAGLVTIERDRVYAHQWFKASTQASVQRIRLPANFEGNGYITVQYIRDPGSNEIFMSPLSYGTTPFSVSLDKRTNKLAIGVPAKIKPGEALKIKLATTQPTRAVVFAVDEGILQVARYKEADPLAFFFQKRALDVRTSQILDLILPEFKRLMLSAAPGGDAEGALGRNLNPFKRKKDKPAVYWSGIVDVSGERELTYAVPDTFNGSLRVMAVAVNDQAIGTAASRTTVQSDFVLSPNAPLAVAPGDEFEVSVGVANNIAGSGKGSAVSLRLSVSPHLELMGPDTQSLKIGERREGVAIYRLKARSGAAAKLGSATMSFAVSLSDDPARSARLATDISVRPASPYYTEVSTGTFKGSVEVAIKRDLVDEYRKTEAAVSPIPLVLVNGLVAYLDNFPHLCTEQVTSRAMPSIVLSRRPEFADPGQKDGLAKARTALASAIAVLRSRQNAEGGFGAWTASVEADEYASVYAIHLLIEASERGFDIPPDMLAKANTWLTRFIASPARDLADVRARAYAIYLATRQGTVTGPALAQLRETLDKRFATLWQRDAIAAYLAVSYKLMKDDRQAAQLMEVPLTQLEKRGVDFRYDRYYDPLIRDAQTLYLVSRHFPERARKLSPEALAEMVKSIQAGRFNTHSAAFVALALDAYAALVETQAGGSLGIAEVGRNGKPAALPLPSNLAPRATFGSGAAKLRFSNAAALNTYYAIAETGFDRTPPQSELKSGMEVVREYLDSEGKPVKNVRVGQEIHVRLKFRSIGRNFVSNVALVDLLPGGFEPVLNPIDTPSVRPHKPGGFVDRIGNVGGWNVQYADVRDDRVVLYGQVSAQIAEYQYRIRATNAGTFIIPPAYAESLYERDIRARSLPATITVERPGK